MSTKTMIYIGMFVGATIGGYIPSLLGANLFSFWPILTSALGGIIGIYLTYKWLNN